MKEREGEKGGAVEPVVRWVGVPREEKRGGEVEREEKRSLKHRKGTKRQKKRER